jgi:hypothetical protein
MFPSPERTSGKNKEEFILGSQNQSTIAEAKCIASGTRRVHHVADSHSGTRNVAVAASRFNFRHTLPNNL